MHVPQMACVLNPWHRFGRPGVQARGKVAVNLRAGNVLFMQPVGGFPQNRAPTQPADSSTQEAKYMQEPPTKLHVALALRIWYGSRSDRGEGAAKA
jgi:hypothetical protein